MYLLGANFDFFFVDFLVFVLSFGLLAFEDWPTSNKSKAESSESELGSFFDRRDIFC